MKQNAFLAMLALGLMSLTSCELIGDIFRAGFYSAIIVVILVVAIIIWLMRSMFGRRG